MHAVLLSTAIVVCCSAAQAKPGFASLLGTTRLVVMKFPILNNKYALMRAYKYTTMEEGDGDAWVERKEFASLLKNLFFFNKVGASKLVSTVRLGPPVKQLCGNVRLRSVLYCSCGAFFLCWTVDAIVVSTLWSLARASESSVSSSTRFVLLTLAQTRTGEMNQSVNVSVLHGQADTERVFRDIDVNDGGEILFDEFCEWVIANHWDVD